MMSETLKMDISAKKVKKKKSNTAIIKDLREKIRRCDKESWKIWKINKDLRGEIALIRKYAPINFYKIAFKIKAANNLIYEYEKIVSAYSIEHAIENIKSNKLHPESFELINIISFGK